MGVFFHIRKSSKIIYELKEGRIFIIIHFDAPYFWLKLVLAKFLCTIPVHDDFLMVQQVV